MSINLTLAIVTFYSIFSSMASFDEVMHTTVTQKASKIDSSKWGQSCHLILSIVNYVEEMDTAAHF